MMWTVGVNASKRNWGAGLATDSPVAGLRSAWRSSRSSLPRHLVSAARYIRAAREGAAPGFAGCSAAWPEGLRNFAVSRRADRPGTFFASPAPRKRPESHPASRSPRPVSSEDAPFPKARSARPARRRIKHRIRSTPKARRLPEFRSRSVGLTRRFYSSVHQTSRFRSSGPGAIIRRVSAFPATGGLTKNMAEAVFFARSPPESVDPRAIGSIVPNVSLARSIRGQRGPMSHLRDHRPHLADRARFSKTRSLSNLPISRRTALVPDVMMLSPNPSRAKR